MSPANEGASTTRPRWGEVNVVTKMKKVNAVIGGEGNGGVIYPAAHYGPRCPRGYRTPSSLTWPRSGKSPLELRKSYPSYFMSKQKVELEPGMDTDAILQAMKERFSDQEVTDIDGVKIDFTDKWVHLRKSNTEPIIRVYSEAGTALEADEIGKQIIHLVTSPSHQGDIGISR